MASTSETGYAKQFAEYEDFVKRLVTLGSAYNPPKTDLSLSNLQDKITAGKNAMRSISFAIPLYSKAVDDQTLAFKPLNDRITKSLNYYKVCLSNPEEVDTAKNLADKMRGIQKSKAPAKEGSEPVKSISQSQRSYDSLIENLDSPTSQTKRFIFNSKLQTSDFPDFPTSQLSTFNLIPSKLNLASTCEVGAGKRQGRLRQFNLNYQETYEVSQNTTLH